MKAKIFGPFSLRDELSQEEEALNRVHGIIFISDPDKNDWYSLQKQFSADSLKIVFDENGLINSASYDVSTLWPQYFSVAEVLSVPEHFSLPVPGGKWVFNGKSIVEKVITLAEQVTQAAETRAIKSAAATVIIDPLRDAVELGRASEEEKARLTAWKNYRIDLAQLDISVPSAIQWPEPPEDVA